MESRQDGREALPLPSAKPEPTIAASANKCLESFNEALELASIHNGRDFSMVEDYYARFSTWAATMGVFESARASMDHRLRVAPDVRNVVNGLLESLSYRILICSTIFDKMVRNVTTKEMYSQNTQLQRAFSHIGTEISHLNKISNTIRRASQEKQIQRARKVLITDDEGTNIEATLSNQFVHLIRDRFHLIREDVELRGDTELEQRLVRSMILRWKRVLYGRHHEGIKKILVQQIRQKAFIQVPKVVERRSIPGPEVKDGEAIHSPSIPFETSPSIVRSAATTLDAQKFKKISSSPSIISSRKTIDWSGHGNLIFPEAPGFLKKRAHEKRMIKAEAQYKLDLRDEDLPMKSITKLEASRKASLEAAGEIMCPYCLHALPAQVVFVKRKWEDHVKGDLNPYVCLFKDCAQPDMMFSNSEEWLKHMSHHAKTWKCSHDHDLCHFFSREEYMHHMREIHTISLSETQLRTMANRNARNSKPLFAGCPMCGENKPEIMETLESHIIGHLRYLALRSLPSYDENIPDEIAASLDCKTGGTSGLRSESTIHNLLNDEEASDAEDPEASQLLIEARENSAKTLLGEDHDFTSNLEWPDIMDGWPLVKESDWRAEHDPVLQLFLKKSSVEIEGEEPPKDAASVKVSEGANEEEPEVQKNESDTESRGESSSDSSLSVYIDPVMGK